MIVMITAFSLGYSVVIREYFIVYVFSAFVAHRLVEPDSLRGTVVQPAYRVDVAGFLPCWFRSATRSTSRFAI